jgi:hypothetical protein
MKRAYLRIVLLVIVLAPIDLPRAETYDDAPDYILNARLSKMTSPPSYNLYVKFETRKQEPLDFWYRLRFDNSNTFVSATPVYSTSNDSALIRSINDFPSWQMFRPGSDTSLRDEGYLVRIGLRNWVGQCQYDAVPDPSDSAFDYDFLPMLIGSDSVAMPGFCLQPGFRAKMKVEYYVNEYGDVCCVMIQEGSGWALFDLFALDIAEGWHYHPAFLNDKPAGAWMSWEISTGEPPDSTTAGR